MTPTELKKQQDSLLKDYTLKIEELKNQHQMILNVVDKMKSELDKIKSEVNKMKF